MFPSPLPLQEYVVIENPIKNEIKDKSNRFDSSLPVEIVPRKKHFPSTDIYKDWNYLEGEGPSSSKYSGIEEKKRWKSGWKCKKSYTDINPFKQRTEHNLIKEQLHWNNEIQRKNCLNNWSYYNNFDPIRGVDYINFLKPDDKLLNNANDNHVIMKNLKKGMPINKIKEVFSKQERSNKLHEMRKIIIENNGLKIKNGKGGTTVKELLKDPIS